MNKAQAILYLFPNANPMTDFEVRDDSNGEPTYISKWNIDAPQPTVEELQEAWDDNQLTEEEAFAQYKLDKIDELDALCNKSILGTFVSSAMGDEHVYVFDMEAQMNFAGAKQAFQESLIETIEWNTRDAGAFVHNLTQFNALWLDGFVHKVTTIGKFRLFKQQILSEDADTVEKVDAILAAW